MTGTLQDVHPDKLSSLRTTADLVFEEILRLEKSKREIFKPQPNLTAADTGENIPKSISSMHTCFSPWPSPSCGSARGTRLDS